MARRTAARWGVASVALAIVALLAGCATIPSSGGVHAGNRQSTSDTLDFDLLASSPRAGATQEEILQGFLGAATDPRSNYSVARQFLTPQFAGEWRADVSATIDDLADREFLQLGDAQMQVQASPSAALGPNGQYEVTDSSVAIPLDYRFEEVEGEWRISDAPDGLLIDSFDFVRVYRTHTLYFYDPQFEYAVPDVRWFAGREAVQTSIVRALLAGPAEWLQPGVRSAFPDGSRLQADAVPIEAGVADVDIDTTAADLRTVQRMEDQLELSLESVRSVTEGVRLSLNGAVQDPPDTVTAPIVNPRADARPAVFDGKVFGYLTSDEGVQPIPGIGDQVARLAPRAAALGPGGESVAVLGAEGVSFIASDEEPVVLDPREGLVTPVLDSRGVVWSAPAANPDQVVVYPPGGEARPVLVPWTGSRLVGLQVSRDGTRLIALVVDGARTRFVAAAIARDADGVPVEVGPTVLQLAEVPGTPLDLAWLDDRTVAALSDAGDGSTRIVQQAVGAPSASDPGPADGRSMVGGNAARDVQVLTSGGQLTSRSGVGWQVQADGLQFAATQQPG